MIFKNKRLLIYLTLVIILLASLFFLSKPQRTDTYKVQKKKMTTSVYASGYIDSSDSVVLKAEVSGTVQTIMVTEGDEIKTGQVLLILYHAPVSENLKDMEAQIGALSERLRPDSDFQRGLLQYIEMKRVSLSDIEKTLNRLKALYQEGLVSEARFDEIRREHELAKRDYERQINQFQDNMTSLNYQLEGLKAKRQALKAELDKYYIRSPINGRVLRRFVNVGDYVNHMQQGNALFSIGNERNIETLLFVDEEYIPKIKEGMKVYISLDAYPGEVFEGVIKAIDGQSDRTTRTLKVKADVNYGKPVFFGLTVEANIITVESEGIFIPESAYRDGYVEVFEGGRTDKLKVRVSPERSNGYLHVTEGLREGQEILIR